MIKRTLLLFLCGALIGMACSGVLAVDLTSSADKADLKAPEDAPVTLDGKVLFVVRTSALSYGAKGRAQIIEQRLQNLLRDPKFRADSLSVYQDTRQAEIIAGTVFIMTVTDLDADLEGKSRSELAEERLRAVQDGIRQYQKARTWEARKRAVIYSIFLLLGFIFVVVALWWVRHRLFLLIDRHVRDRATEDKISLLDRLTDKRLERFLKVLVRIVSALLLAGAFLTVLFAMISLFPATHILSLRLMNWIADPFTAAGDAVVAYLPNLVSLAIILLLTYLVTRLSWFFFNHIERGTISLPRFYPEWALPTHKIVRFLIIAMAAVVAFPYLPGSDSPAFKGISLFVGILLSLGSTSIVANIVSGVMLTYTMAFKIGDRVKIGETLGDVLDKTLLVTRVQTIKNVVVAIPNAVVLGGAIRNYSAVARTSGLILNTAVTIGYDAPWRTIHRLLIAAAERSDHVLKTPSPFVLQTALNDFYVSYELNAYTDRPDLMVSLYSELHQNIQDAFNEAGVEIMSPHYTQLRDGNRTAIPGNYLSKDYAAPGLRVNILP